jgi:prepilin-type N-terminal cleavage/methylation domain-containing protein
MRKINFQPPFIIKQSQRAKRVARIPNSQLRFKSGFTLIEILVYIAILGILIIPISSFLIWSNRSNIKAKVMRETLEDARRAMEIMTREIKEAKSIYTPTTNPNQLSLETINYLPTDEETTYIDFFLCGSSICFKKESQGPVSITKDNIEVNQLVFTRIVSGDSTSIQIELGMNYKNPGNRPEYQATVNLTSTASLRSY